MLITNAVSSSVYFLGACLHLFHYLLLTRHPSTLHLSWRWLREGLLLMSATLTLAIPGMALMVYRHFDADGDDWDLHPIPTLLGYVDPRRFYTFCLGQGSMASNAFYDADMGSMDTIQHGGGGILHPPKSLVIARTMSSDHHHHHHQQQDEEEAGEEDGAKTTSNSGNPPRMEKRIQLSDMHKAYEML